MRICYRKMCYICLYLFEECYSAVEIWLKITLLYTISFHVYKNTMGQVLIFQVHHSLPVILKSNRALNNGNFFHSSFDSKIWPDLNWIGVKLFGIFIWFRVNYSAFVFCNISVFKYRELLETPAETLHNICYMCALLTF